MYGNYLPFLWNHIGVHWNIWKSLSSVLNIFIFTSHLDFSWHPYFQMESKWDFFMYRPKRLVVQKYTLKYKWHQRNWWWIIKKITNILDVCELDEDAGPCNAYFPKFYYNKQSRKCLQFVYGGCGGNGNQFNSLTDCESMCLSRQARPSNETDPGKTSILNIGNSSYSHKLFCYLHSSILFQFKGLIN